MKHVFITGCPRSGTTMLASMIGSGEDCIATPESDFFVDNIYKNLSKYNSDQSKSDLIEYFNKNYRFKQWSINPKDIQNIPNKINFSNYGEVIENTVSLYAEKHASIKTENLVRIDHTPSSIKYFDALNNLFPNAKYIFILRDPRAVFASVKSLDWGANTPLKLGEIWNEYVGLFLAIKRMFPKQIHLIKYENILTNAEAEIQKACDFINIEYNDSLLLGHGFKIPGYTARQHKLVGKNLDKSRIEKWKENLNEKEISIIESNCKILMQAFDYNLTNLDYQRIDANQKIKMIIRETKGRLTNRFKKKSREKKS